MGKTTWVGTIGFKHSVRVVFHDVHREDVWARMLGFLDRCDAARCVVALTRLDFFVPTAGDLIEGVTLRDQLSRENTEAPSVENS